MSEHSTAHKPPRSVADVELAIALHWSGRGRYVGTYTLPEHREIVRRVAGALAAEVRVTDTGHCRVLDEDATIELAWLERELAKAKARDERVERVA